ncbi:MAG: hypothetical protein LBR65_02630 [Culturomica sp.]|jgi:hypothetical protein|nr:hypothetical protein [Culturomica sp.]
MIDIQVRIHDRFSVEFKMGFLVPKKQKKNDFVVNTWIFIPSGLDIHASTYSKNQFYRDITSYIRLITPIYNLREIADEESLPFMFLQGSFNELIAEPTKENLNEYEHQIKMFTAIVRSALRREGYVIANSAVSGRLEIVQTYIQNIRRIIAGFRKWGNIIRTASLPTEAISYFTFGDEFLSYLIEQHGFRLLRLLKDQEAEDYPAIEPLLMELIRQEIRYKKACGYIVADSQSPDQNRTYIHHARILKRYIESQLFLGAEKKKDGRLTEQVYLSIAAGLSMVFATAVAFSVQQQFENYTMPLFVALVVSYILKDRIKELARYYFARHLSKKHFDNKTTVRIKNTVIGQFKEGTDFISEAHVPKEIVELRNRSDLLEADNRYAKEKILLYRKLVNIDGEKLDTGNQYDISGINNILRFNISNFVLKMDNPEVPISVPNAAGGFDVISGKRIYYLNFLVRLEYENTVAYRRFRLSMSRSGIEGIEDCNF